MPQQLRFLPQAESDLRIGRAWYEERSPGVGDAFLHEFFATIDDILEHPLLYRTEQGDVRRRLLRRFPYSIYFLVEGTVVLVVGVFHCARDPQGIEDELRDRDL